MEFTVRCYIIHEWLDQRLARKNHHTVIRTDASNFWVPDTYCLNCRKTTIGENSRQLIRVDEDGSTYLSQLSQLYASCIMNLERFPFDVQTCKIQFGSYSLNNSYINLYWSKEVTLEHMVLDQFTVRNRSKTTSRIVTYQQGNFTVLEAELYFERQMGFYVMQFMVPSICLVFLSWITLFMSPEDVGNRVAIGVTLILTMIFMLGYVNNNLPKVAYVKAIDLFLLVSLIMIIVSVLESAVLYWIQHKEIKKIMKKSQKKDLESSLSRITSELCIPMLEPNENNTNGHTNGHTYGHNLNVHHAEVAHRYETTLNDNFTQFMEDKAIRRMVLKDHLSMGKLSKIDLVARAVLPMSYILYTFLYLYIYIESPVRKKFETVFADLDH